MVLYGAGDEARTRYLHLGKVALYRMSYTRMGCVPQEHDALYIRVPDLSTPFFKNFKNYSAGTVSSAGITPQAG